MTNNTKTKSTARHRADTKFTDHRSPKHYGLGTVFGRAKHRAEGPMNVRTMHDMSPDEFTAIKGAGPRY